MRWTNVKTKKPPYEKMVLVTAIGDKTQYPRPRLMPQIACIILSNAKGDLWLSDNGGEVVGEVTHWMPLPPDPLPLPK